MSKGAKLNGGIPASLLNDGRANARIPITTRMSIEIPKPKDWQAFQRNCVLLFRSELNDPHTQEYGRGGQDQGGIDILGRRDGNDQYFVGIQCRLITKPLKERKILSDARAAIKLQAGLKELIFATTAPDDTGAANAAISVERTLKEEGHDLRVVVYGWGQLQTVIAVHEVAYNAFHPSAVGSSAPQNTGQVSTMSDVASLVATVVEQLRSTGLNAAPRESASSSDEDRALHARIDTYRDLFQNEGEPLLAEKGLLSILDKEDLSSKPWARYRVETNLGSIALDLGRETEGASRFEAAYAMRPDDPNALANLALARTIQGRFDEAMTAARCALDAEPRADHAVGYLLQVAARSDWEGDPESLIPPDLVNSRQADIGLAEFLRRRDVPGWAERSLEMARRHATAPEFKRIRAFAVLSLAIESGTIIPGGFGPVTIDELNAAADDMKAMAEHYIEVGFSDQFDLMVHINNAAVLLRLCERHAESEALLKLGMPKLGDVPQLRRLLALACMVQERNADAIAALEGDNDPENVILKADLQASLGDLAGALKSVLEMDATALPGRIGRLRWRVIGESALRLNDEPNLRAAVNGLRILDPDDLSAHLLEIMGERKSIADAEATQQKLRTLAASVSADLDMVSRYFLAAELRNQDLPDEASQLLDGKVDLTRPSPSTSLYLETLAASRRDTAFKAALTAAGPEVQKDPATLWTVAAHAWNIGDLTGSMAAVDALLVRAPEALRARLLKIEIFIRQDRSAEVFAELEQPLEKLDWRQPSDQFRLAKLLGHFGFVDRAADFAYGLFLKHRDLSQAWLALFALVLDEGRGAADKPRKWAATAVATDAAVDLAYDDGTTEFFVVEPSATLRKLDAESWEPDHSLIRALSGLREGDRFQTLDGREGVVRQIRHKYVARLHYVLENHERRFPDIAAFKRFLVDADQPGAPDALISQLKAHRDWFQEAEDQYLKSPMPIGALALRVGMDTIEAAGGVVSHGSKLKVAAGNLEEREAAKQAVRANRKSGCVLDLLAFWTAWRSEALEVLCLVCGSIHLPQSVLDRLRARRDRFEFNARDGLSSAGYQDGKLVLTEVSAEDVQWLRNDLDRAIAWAEANTTVSPVMASDDLPDDLRDHIRLGQSDVFHALVLARQLGVLLVTDDLATREVDRVFGGNGGTWLHVVFGLALDWKRLDADRYVKLSAQFVAAGHSYLGVSGPVLAHAAYLDVTFGKAPGDLFRTLSREIGGQMAEPRSHAIAVVECLDILWHDPSTVSWREPVTGLLLRQLIRERSRDFAIIIRAVVTLTNRTPPLSDYINGWLQGHFLEKAVRG